ncbi:MAG: transketolase, partial [Rhodocyclaceae bacterium]|nr:transketolase [Rhodocyclaceae bacterium]
VEHAASLRLIPNLDVWRPADTVETAAAWAAAVERADGPTALLLSRQNLPCQPRSAEQLRAIARGAYVLREAADGAARAVIIATGSELPIALAAQQQLAEAGVPVRVVSMPSTNVFDRQDAAWKAAVLPAGLPRVAVEAGHCDFWYKYVGFEGTVVGLATFGESAPIADLYRHFGLTAERVANAVQSVLPA